MRPEAGVDVGQRVETQRIGRSHQSRTICRMQRLAIAPRQYQALRVVSEILGAKCEMHGTLERLYSRLYPTRVHFRHGQEKVAVRESRLQRDEL